MKRSLVFLSVFSALSAAMITGFIVSGHPVACFSDNPVRLIVILSGCAAAVSFFFGIITSDYSWVDRMWSILPAVFAWIYYAYSSYSPLLLSACIMVTLRAVRLSFNFARKGGYTGAEDYRWPILRKKISNPVLWQLFHLLFINGLQISLFVLFTLPLKYISAAVEFPPGKTCKGRKQIQKRYLLRFS